MPGREPVGRSGVPVRRVYCEFEEPPQKLGCVDEFDQAEACGEGDDRPEVPGCLFASEGDAFEALEASDALLDASPCLVEGSGEEGRLVFFVGLVRNDGSDAARSRGVPIGVAGVAVVER